jgi:hypothetical protein
MLSDPTTQGQFAMVATYITKASAQWSGDLQNGIVSGIYKLDEPAREESLKRYRKEIEGYLDLITR